MSEPFFGMANGYLLIDRGDDVMRVKMIGVVVGLAGFLALGRPVLARQVADSDVAEKCESVCQDNDAPWRSVAWQTDLIDAQKLAVEQQKPLFVWAMDGHPLGCT